MAVNPNVLSNDFASLVEVEESGGILVLQVLHVS
jgi:hypothetical protein